MPDYSKGQIYKIVDNGFNKCYIGSTVETLAQRMTKHRNHYKMHKEGKRTYIHLFKLFDEFGVENCKIYWIEDYACNSKKELEAREGHHIQIIDCVNKRIEGRSKQQWNEDNIEKVREWKRQWEIDNWDYIKTTRSIEVKCDCGAVVFKPQFNRHLKTKKHQQYLQSLEQSN